MFFFFLQHEQLCFDPLDIHFFPIIDSCFIFLCSRIVELCMYHQGVISSICGLIGQYAVY